MEVLKRNTDRFTHSDAEMMHGCLFVRAESSKYVDIESLLRMHGISQDAQSSSGHASRFGVRQVYGTHADLLNIQGLGIPACDEVRAEVKDAISSGLGNAEVQWLDGFGRDRASDTLFSYLTGFNALRGRSQTFPIDEDALAKCMQLLESVPSLKAKLNLMSELNEQWERLVVCWDLLENLLNDEAQLTASKRRNACNSPTRMALRALLRTVNFRLPPDEQQIVRGRVAHIDRHPNGEESVYVLTIDGHRFVWNDATGMRPTIVPGASVEFKRLGLQVVTPGSHLLTRRHVEIVSCQDHSDSIVPTD